MICYKDKTWCIAYTRCPKGNKCSRALTSDVVTAATRWWGKPGAPIAQADLYKTCFPEGAGDAK